MNDQQRWQRASEAACLRYEQLPGDTAERLEALVGRIMGLKEELLELALAAGSASTCRSCGGACCRNGKYHVSLLDLLAYRITGSETVCRISRQRRTVPMAESTAAACRPVSGR